MGKKRNVFLIFLSIALIVCFIIFARRNNPYSGYSKEEYVENLQKLSDSIQVLQSQVKEYEEELKNLSLERDTIRQEIIQIVKTYEKKDSSLTNGTWDDYIRILTEYLSKKDSI